MGKNRIPSFLRRPRKSKLKNSRICTDGYWFASKLEAAVYLQLKRQVTLGEIEILKHQARIALTEASIIYVPDFVCRNLRSGHLFYVEAKGFATPDWKIKKKLWSVYGPAPLQIWRGTYARPYLEEVITPQPELLKTNKVLFTQNSTIP
jgi:predicted nuclease of restriction endonuclease-like RecB superfamily